MYKMEGPYHIERSWKEHFSIVNFILKHSSFKLSVTSMNFNQGLNINWIQIDKQSLFSTFEWFWVLAQL